MEGKLEIRKKLIKCLYLRHRRIIGRLLSDDITKGQSRLQSFISSRLQTSLHTFITIYLLQTLAVRDLQSWLGLHTGGGVAGGAGGAAAPPGFWMGSKKILGKTTEFGKKTLLRIAPLLPNF